MEKRVRQRKGYYRGYGGAFIPETLMPAVEELEQAFKEIKRDKEFKKRFKKLLKDYNGRPTPLFHAENMTRELNGADIFIKREDLNHTGAHKITNSLGQALIAEHLGKKRIIAETGAGQHGVATATAASLLGLECTIFMGTTDMKRQEPNVFRMKLLGAEVVPVESGGKTLKDAVNETLKNWTASVRDTHYIMGSALGPHPFPAIVKYFQSVIGSETAKQFRLETGSSLPDMIIACVGGGSNAIGIFAPFIDKPGVKLVGVEAGGRGITTGDHAVRLSGKKDSAPGIFHGTHSYVLQNREGQIRNTYSISAGLDYSGIGPEHACLFEEGRVEYTYATDRKTLQAFRFLCRKEGIIPALESSHALAECIKRAPKMKKTERIVVNLSGRGDKDLDTVINRMNV